MTPAPLSPTDRAFAHDARDPRRAAQRWPAEADVEMLVPAGGHGLVLNVSGGGLRLMLDRTLMAGETCVLRVRHGSGDETVEHGRVVWSQPRPDGCIVGLAFVAPG